MKTLVLLSAAALLLIAAGCSSIQVMHDYDSEIDFSLYSTYRWIPKPAKLKAPHRASLVEKRIRRAVDSELAGKGMEEVSSAPDLLLAHHGGMERKIDVADWGYTYRGRGWYSKDISVHRYREGTLVIDLIDAKSKELIWRGVAQSTLSARPNPEESQKNISEAVAAIFEKFPPGVAD